jgi:diguanylate cyclase (GGDEF)-like protein/PAS domain S-box-containing protein
LAQNLHSAFSSCVEARGHNVPFQFTSLSNPNSADGEPLAAEVRAEQVRLLFQQAPTGAFGSIAVGSVLVAMLWNETPARWLLAWAGALGIISLLRVILVAAFHRFHSDVTATARWGWSYLVVVGLTGAAWGASTALLAVTPSLTYQLFIVLSVGGTVVGAIATTSGSLRTFMAFSVPALAPVIGWYLARGATGDVQTATLFIFFAIVVGIIARRFEKNLTASLRMRVENRGLVWTLSAANQELAQANQNTDALNRLLHLSLESTPLERRLDDAVEIVCSVSWIPFSGKGAIFVADENARQLRLAAKSQLASDIPERCDSVDYGTCLCGRAALSREIEFADHLDERHEVRVEGMAEHGHYSVPIVAGDTLLGVIVLYLDYGHRRNAAEVEFLRTAAATLAAVIQRCRAEDELRLAASVFDNSVEGIVITDASGVILKTNPAVTTITGYEPGDMRGRTPRVWRSDQHDPAFYAQLWQALQDTGRWQGEIWNRRKNGELFPVWQTVVSVGDLQSDTLRYIGMFRDISEHKRAEDHMRLLAYHDVLTDLPNRRVFEDRLEQAVERARRRGQRVALLIVDLYRFRVINDSLGYRAGDDILRHVAHRLRAALRHEDTVARIGGDAFGVILDDVADAGACEKTAQKLIGAVTAPVTLRADGELSPACVIGIGMYPDDAADARSLVTNTDAAMHDAERLGENRFSFYSVRLSAEAAERLALERALRRALDRDELVLYYQPQYGTRLGHVTGAEALVRWEHPDLGMVPPSRFIPLAEETRLILPLSRWVLQRATQQWAALSAGRDPALRLGVNVSVHQFQDPDFVTSIAGALRASGMPAPQLELEITESVLLQDAAAAIPRLKDLKDLGVRIALDDFGTGYSSLSYLASLPIDTVKIDRAFIRHITSDTTNGALVRAILQMCRALELDVVVEGVETTAQYAMLREMGVDVIQGFLFGKPVPAEMFNHRPAAGASAVSPAA